ncbi:MAG: xanthine dehydrogenase family protein subunit M [Pseudomonadota bacterium]
MLLPKFDYHSPESLEAACGLMAEYSDRAKLLAGGTDLLVNMKRKLLAPAQVVSLDRVPGLSEVTVSETGLSLGALVTAAQVARSRELKGPFKVLAQAAASLGSPLIRNRATLGGNLVTARPAADTAPPLLALGASVHLTSTSGTREVPLKEFFLGPGRSVILPEEILVSITIPQPEPGSGGCFLKLGVRRAMERAIVSVAAVITLSADEKEIRDARVAVGAAAPTPIRSLSAEAELIGRSPDQATLARAAQAVCADINPRGRTCSIDYTTMMAEVLARRALTQALAEAGQE